MVTSLLAKSNGETIREHTDKLLQAYDCFVNLYGNHFESDVLAAVRYACEYHDYGKSVYMFQKVLGNPDFQKFGEAEQNIYSMYKDIGIETLIPHGYLSPAFLPLKTLKSQLGLELVQILISAIYYHHTRSTKLDAVQLQRVITEDLKVRFPDLKLSAKYFTYLLGDYIDDSLWSRYAIVLGLLNRFDYHASDTNCDKLDVEIDCRQDGRTMQSYVSDFLSSDGRHYRTVQEFALENADNNVIITASTGLGKTEAALLWGGDSKLFYTLPLKVSINAMYSRLCSKYGISQDKITLLHSDAFSYFMSEDNDNNGYLKYEASKRLSYPLTVCTVDQLFTFVYKYRGCEPIFASLVYSKIVIDEIQSYEPKVVAKLLYGLKLLTDCGCKFAILTATLPPVFTHFISKLGISHAPQRSFFTDKIRHKISYTKKSDFDYDLIVKEAQTKKVLIICNTVSRAIEVYTQLRSQSLATDVDYIKLLHSKYIRRHRKMLEEEILRFADSDETGIWVTTQIVEASLDLDFDVLFTEMCTADSLLQRMGRCYRNRNYSGTEPNVYILNNYNGYGTVYSYKDIYNRSVLFLMRYTNGMFSEVSKAEYIDAVYNTEDLKGTAYYEEIRNELLSLTHIVPFKLTKEESLAGFRGLEPMYSVVPYSVYNKNVDSFNKCKDILSGRTSVSFAERQEVRNFVENNTLTISTLYDKRTKDCDTSILGSIGYYTLGYTYDFDEDTLTGAGLLYTADDV